MKFKRKEKGKEKENCGRYIGFTPKEEIWRYEGRLKDKQESRRKGVGAFSCDGVDSHHYHHYGSTGSSDRKERTLAVAKTSRICLGRV